MALERKWITTDGKQFDNYAEARRHENEIAGPEAYFRTWCEENICVGGEWSAEMVARAILEEFLVPRRRK